MNVAIMLRGIVTLLWLGIIGLIVLGVVRASRGKSARAISIAVLVVAILAIVLTSISAGLVFIQPELRGVGISAFLCQESVLGLYASTSTLNTFPPNT